MSLKRFFSELTPKVIWLIPEMFKINAGDTVLLQPNIFLSCQEGEFRFSAYRIFQNPGENLVLSQNVLHQLQGLNILSRINMEM